MRENDYLRKALKVYYLDPGLALHRAVEAKMFNKYSLVSPILELGCGDGSFSYVCYGADELENEETVSFSVEDIRRSMVDDRIDIGIDIVANAVRQAKNKSIHKNVLVADINNLPFKNPCFKTIISNSVITHIYDLDKALNEIARILYPEGKFIFTVPSEYFGEYLFSTQICKALGFKNAGPFFVRNYLYLLFHLVNSENAPKV
jgi:ubiquinone/menaquinone biosynthesis C-methylase UbiE